MSALTRSHILARDGEVQCRVPRFDDVRVGAFVEQEQRHLGVVVVRRQHQGSLADAGRRIQVGARGDEYLDRAEVTVSGCEEQGRQSALVQSSEVRAGMPSDSSV